MLIDIMVGAEVFYAIEWLYSLVSSCLVSKTWEESSQQWVIVIISIYGNHSITNVAQQISIYAWDQC